MKKIIITLKESSLRTVVKNNSFDAEGLYQFIAVEFNTEKSGVARPYHSVQVSRNNWTYYPGVKVWDADGVKMSKARALEQIIERAKDAIENEIYSMNLYSEESDGIRYELNYVEN